MGLKVEQSRVPNYYDYLKVERNATALQIKQAYRKLAYIYHPDRIDFESKGGLNEQEMILKFSQVNAAYQVLGDELKRKMYDTVEDIQFYTTEEICELKKVDAKRDVDLMIATYRRSYDEESEAQGLIILTAYYGCFPNNINPFLPLSEQNTGEIIEVSVPLQCMINSSQLICNDKRGKSWLPGFYDPCIGLEKKLIFRYVFKGHQHQAIIKDDEPFRAPLKQHLVQNTTSMEKQEERAHNKIPFHLLHGQTKYIKLIKRRKRRRRILLLSSLIFCGSLLYSYRPDLVSQAGKILRSSSAVFRQKLYQHTLTISALSIYLSKNALSNIKVAIDKIAIEGRKLVQKSKLLKL